MEAKLYDMQTKTVRLKEEMSRRFTTKTSEASGSPSRSHVSQGSTHSLANPSTVICFICVYMGLRRPSSRTVYNGWPFSAKSGSLWKSGLRILWEKALRLHAEGPYHIKNIRTIKTNQSVNQRLQFCCPLCTFLKTSKGTDRLASSSCTYCPYVATDKDSAGIVPMTPIKLNGPAKLKRFKRIRIEEDSDSETEDLNLLTRLEMEKNKGNHDGRLHSAVLHEGKTVDSKEGLAEGKTNVGTAVEVNGDEPMLDVPQMIGSETSCDRRRDTILEKSESNVNNASSKTQTSGSETHKPTVDKDKNKTGNNRSRTTAVGLSSVSSEISEAEVQDSQGLSVGDLDIDRELQDIERVLEYARSATEWEPVITGIRGKTSHPMNEGKGRSTQELGGTRMRGNGLSLPSLVSLNHHRNDWGTSHHRNKRGTSHYRNNRGNQSSQE
ncbi:hypothetical protein DPMN_009125 [Dreissena polymorpha]|uniref:Uncharacterized protein n=1 Tax=Dreissena polymorpha TaxID=45954 RepID=A0A9D4RZS4_DREPO|nr:hypothetical protein DPMN_009125 [Dreissena polymorpha]